MELAEGKLPDGRPYIRRSRCSRAARRRSRSARTRPTAWGSWSTRSTASPVVHHGGDMIGFHSDMMWLPEHDVGAVILTNARSGLDPAHASSGASCSRCCSTASPRPTAQIAAGRRSRASTQIAAERKLLTVPADAGASAKLATRYANAALGDDRGDDGRGRPSSTSASGRARSRRARTPTARSRSSRPLRASRASSSSWARDAKKTLVRATRSTSTCSKRSRRVGVYLRS